jgi:hypothetical protein
MDWARHEEVMVRLLKMAQFKTGKSEGVDIDHERL